MIESRIDQARALLTPPVVRSRPFAPLAAAALVATAAVLMAGVMVLGPGVRFEEAAASAQP